MDLTLESFGIVARNRKLIEKEGRWWYFKVETVLKYARENGRPWDEETCSQADVDYCGSF